MADTIPGNTSSITTLSINTSAVSAIDVFADTDWWRVNLVYGYQYQVWLEGSWSGNGTLVDPYLAIYNSVGTFQHANNDISIYTYDAYFTTTPNSTGTFYLSAEEFGNNGTGSYTITIWQDELASISTAANIAANSLSPQGHIGWQDDTADWYTVSLTAGIQYQFDLIGSSNDGSLSGLSLSDPWLALHSSSGTVLLSDDNSGLGLNSRIFFTPTTSGTYFLDAQESGSNAYGIYQLIVNATPSRGTLALGVSQAGSIDFNGDADLYSVSLTAGVAYAFAVDGTTLIDPYIEVLNSAGTSLLYYDDDSGLSLNSYLAFTPTTSGTYYLAARESGNDATGGYTARVWQIPTVSIANAVVLEGNSGTTTLVFTLSLSEASPIPVTITAATSGTATATYSVDYVPISSVITFPAGQTSATFTVGVLPDSIFEPTESFHVLLSDPNYALLGDSDAIGLIGDNDNPYSLPTDSLARLQWYLYPTTGVNVFPIWNDYTGAGVRVAIFDQGIDTTHADLDGSLLTGLGRNAFNLSVGGAPFLSTDNHGTAVAGVIAAELNGDGIVGVAYGANLVSIYNGMTLAEIPNAFYYAANFDILNNSWGFAPQGTSYYALYGNWAFNDNFLAPAFSEAGTALATLAATGRNGLGTIVVQSAGNSFSVGDDTNLHNFQNSQYIVTVAATDYSGNVTSYSSPGASVLIAAPGGGGTDLLSNIITTDRVGIAGNDASDYASIAGTSFSAPIVSGIVALMLEANSNLGYRDVQEILAYSARETSSDSNEWSYNGASNWNGSGLHYDGLSHNLGFGLIDARAAVRLAETWSSTSHTVANKQQITLSHSPALSIPDNTGSSAFDTILVTQAIDIERVAVTLNVTHSYIGDLSVLLVSPSGTTSFLLWRPQQNPLSAYGTAQNNIHFTFDTVLNWGESSLGTWGIGIYDNAYGDFGTFDSWTLNLIGKPASADDTYIYTDEFAESCADQAARGTLSDSGGIDTLNAAACSTNLVLDLTAGGTSTIDGRSLTTAAGTIIENAYAGDGNDAVYGNSATNILYGMRGDDRLDGSTGTDSLIGGAGNDIYVVDNVADVVTENLNEGNDLIQSEVSYSISADVENLTLTGASAISGTGNALDNILTGNDAANSLNGGLGNDVMYGGAGDDTFDWDVNQGFGDDTIYGGSGNDVYVISGSDQIIEYSDAGIDTIWSSQSYSLVPLPYVENLSLLGSSDENLTGNDSGFGNILVGNSGNNFIEGRGGNDRIVGGDGSDTAVFSGAWSQYILTPLTTGWTLAGPDGTDTLSEIEFASFADQSIPLGNFAPTGAIAISGTTAQNQILTVDSTLADIDGLGTISYQWRADGSFISGETNSTLVLKEAQVGKTITVTASYTDVHGTNESVISIASTAIANINDPPSGIVSIHGTLSQGQTLTASYSLNDPDGMGAIDYQWKSNGISIIGATASTFALTEAEVEKLITVTAIYIDGHSTTESVTSATIGSVTNVNDAPTGSVTITGEPVVGATLTAENTLTDQDGLGSISYQWESSPDGNAGWIPIEATTADHISLNIDYVGRYLRAMALYNDAHGTAETAMSTSVQLTANVGIHAFSWKAHTLLTAMAVGDGSHSGTTGTNGRTSFTGVTDTVLPLTAERPIPSDEAALTDQAVNLQDAIAILKMIVGLDVNGAGQALSPYQAYAADFDGNGAVGLTDAIGVLKHVVGLPSPDPGWLFFNEIDATVPGKANLAPGELPATIPANLTGTTAQVHVGLVGVLRGDVDGSFAGAAGAQDLDTTQPTYFQSLTTSTGLNLSQFGIYGA